MENTVNNKMAFFAQYWGQKVLHIRNSPIPFHLSSMKPSDILESDYLSLKPLSSISNEDAIEVAKYGGWDILLTPMSETEGIRQGGHWAKEISRGVITCGFDCADYLRSKSYALPFMGLSVETLVEYGWCKLTN